MAESTSGALALVVAALSWVGAIPVVLLEAFLLAGGQRWVLRGRHAGLERGWFFATLTGTLLGRSVQFAAAGSGIATAVAMMPPTAVQAAFGALLGALVGALMAAPQAFILRRRIKQAGRWVAIRALAWSTALPSLLLAGGWMTNAPAYEITGLALAMSTSFALVGAFVGLLEGYALTRLMRFVIERQARLAALRRRSGPCSRRSKRLPDPGCPGRPNTFFARSDSQRRAHHLATIEETQHK
jgi:hypothetical protein